jgi:ankyrin repeat protein
VEAIVILLDAGKDVNCVDTFDTTPIMWALDGGQLLAAIMLFGRGADLSRVNNYGSNLLHSAVAGGRECIEWVLANTSIDVNSAANNGSTPIRSALINNRLDVAKLLVERGANPFMKVIKGYDDVDDLGHDVLQHAKDLI